MTRYPITRMPGRCLVVAGLAVLLVGCASEQGEMGSARTGRPPMSSAPDHSHPDHRPHRVVTLAFAGDVHFQIQVAALLDDPRGLGPIRRTLSDADVTMVNLESAITERGTWDPKALERPKDRYWFRAPARALDVLADAGVDVVTVANNHGADLGATGLSDTLRAAREAPLAVVGVGRDRAQAFAPYRVRVHGTELAFLAADASPLESTSTTWTAGRTFAGTGRGPRARPRVLLHAVRRTSHDARRRGGLPALGLDDADLSDGEAAGHRPRPSRGGRRRHRRQPRPCAARFRVDAGHLRRLRSRELRLVSQPAPTDRSASPAAGERPGRLRPVDTGPDRTSGWPPRCHSGAGHGSAPLLTGECGAAALISPPSRPPGKPTSYQPSITRITPSLRERMASSRHVDCPMPWRDLRYLQVNYVGFDGRAHTGELVVRGDARARRRQRLRDGSTTPAGRSGGCGWSTTIGGTTTCRWQPTTPRGSTAAE